MIQNDVVIFSDVAYLPKSAASVKLNLQPTSPVQSPVLNSVGSEIAAWGAGNLRPQELKKQLKELPQAKEIISWQARTLYSGGLIYGKTSFVDGVEKFTPTKDPKVEEFFKKVNITRYLIEACLDYYWYGNPVDELIVDRDTQQIIALASQDSSFFRAQLQNKQTGKIENGYLSANWDFNNRTGNVSPIKLIDPYWDRILQVKSSKDRRFLYHRALPSPGEIYYGELPWHSLVESGWLEVAKAIPAFKKALFKNQISIKYHIEIADWYWQWKYSQEWEKFTPQEKRDKIKFELELIESTLTGTDNAGKSVKSLLRTSADGKFESAVKITPLDDKIKSGVYIEDSQEAFSNILFSFGVDPTLVGNAPGKNMGGGSGSDKRVAYNIYMLGTKAEADLILEPLHFVRDFNNWDPEIQFMFKNYYIATLDQGKEVTK